MGGLSRWGCAVSFLIGCYCWARPVAVVNFNGSTGYGIAPDEELMDGTNSYVTDPDEWIAGFDWDFGDGTPHSSAGWVRHTYQVPGHFVARLTVTGSRGDQDSATLQVQVDGNTTRWVRLLEESTSYLQSSTTDDRIVLFGSSLRKFSPNGSLEWERPQEPQVYAGPIVPATGEIYAGQLRDGGSYPVLVLMRFNAGGLDPVDVATASDFVSVAAVVDDRGNQLLEWSNPAGSSLSYQGLDGTRWEISSPVSRAFWVDNAAFDPRGNLAVAAEVRQAINLQGFDLQPGFTLLKIDASGHILWVHQVPGLFPAGWGASIGVSAIGTLVVGSRFNTPFGWAGQNFDPGPSGALYLLVAEGVDGEERFARQLDDIREPYHYLAVDRVGQVAISGPAINCSGTVVYKYNLAGDLLWRRDLTDPSCNGEVRVDGLGISRHNVILSGGFHGTVDFGNGPETSQAPRHFLVDLGP